jgi:two-component system OmpR family response regulator
MTLVPASRGSQEDSTEDPKADATDQRTDMPSLFELRVLLIEDDRDVALILQRFLLRSGIQAALAHSGAEAVSLKCAFSPHVVLVDLQLPDIDGETLIRWLIAQHDCGIIVVSGDSDEATRVLILELGADDYVIKPPNFRVLVARIRAVYRRSSERMAPQKHDPAQQNVSLGEFTVDLQARQVRDRMAQPVNVTAAEFAVIAALIDAKGMPVSRERLSQIALRRPWHSEDRSVDQLVFGLRRKLSTLEGGRGLIQSIRNGGYVLIISGASEP